MGAFLTVFHPGLYPCVISLCTIQFIPQILITFHLPQAERCAGKWGPKMQSIFGRIKIPETLNLVTERDLGGFRGQPWSEPLRFSLRLVPHAALGQRVPCLVPLRFFLDFNQFFKNWGPIYCVLSSNSLIKRLSSSSLSVPRREDVLTLKT